MPSTPLLIDGRSNRRSVDLNQIEAARRRLSPFERRTLRDQAKSRLVIADNRLPDGSDWNDEMFRLELNDLLECGFKPGI